jgi:antitoxin component YwqK of YwqJK toxin-antitoxin module
MRNLILISALFTFCFSSFSQEVLDNQSVIDMIELGFNEQVIIDKIESTNSSFETSLEKLKSLKLLGVTQNILSIMIKESKVKIPLNGEYRVYWGIGILKSKANYVDGKLQGEHIEYYYTTANQVNIRKNYEDGKLQGEYIEYWKNENLKSKANYVDGKLQGLRCFYYDNGILKSKANYVDGKLQGLRCFYYDNGILKSKAKYVDGKQESMTIHYDIDGNRIK